MASQYRTMPFLVLCIGILSAARRRSMPECHGCDFVYTSSICPLGLLLARVCRTTIASLHPMQTKKEKILIQPFVEANYKNHRRKVFTGFIYLRFHSTPQASVYYCAMFVTVGEKRTGCYRRNMSTAPAARFAQIEETAKGTRTACPNRTGESTAATQTEPNHDNKSRGKLLERPAPEVSHIHAASILYGLVLRSEWAD